MWGKRRSPEAVSLALALLIAGVLNFPFWRLFYSVVAPRSAYEWAFLAAMAAGLLLLFYLLVLLLAVRPLLKPVMTLLLPLTAAATFFMYEYGTVIDMNMVRNVFETNTAEAGDLISPALVVTVLVLGVLPVAALWLTPIDWPSLTADARRKFKAAAIIVPAAFAVLFPFWPAITSTFREHRELRMTLTPSNYMAALNKYIRSKRVIDPAAAKVIAADAARRPQGSERPKTLFVIAVGETTRWDHWALNGYARPTNPELSKVDGLVNYPKAYSCGTDTAESVPCMFSGLSRSGFSPSKAEGQQNLLDVLKRVGIDVGWRENQAGCKGVCARIPTETLTGTKESVFFHNGETRDEILLDGLPARLAGLQQDTVIVLHMMGSHGPAYWKRYPDTFEVFKPVCKESQFSRCTLDGIINAYDNTVLYSDYVLSRLVALLAEGEKANVATGMIYMSDHGESLGENNLYLHGMPYAIAPEAQRHIPMALWLSPTLRGAAALDAACLAREAAREVSHDNLFHSVLGLFEVQTKIYDATLDIFANCRRATALEGSQTKAVAPVQ